MDEKKKITYEEWLEEGKKKFGTEDKRKWKFICPSCGHVQCFEDFISAGATEEEASGMIAFSCVGRVMEEKGEFLKDKKKPCNYAGGGLFRMNPTQITAPDGSVNNYFAFAERQMTVKEMIKRYEKNSSNVS